MVTERGGRGSRIPAPSRCAVWGIVNVTRDSFSDGGRFLAANDAVNHGETLLAEGADVLDVGGESSRPAGATYGEGARGVSIEEEIERVVPVVERLVSMGATVSVDTVKPEVATEALRAGATIINDVSARADDRLLAAVASAGAELVRMHNRGRGEVQEPNTIYEDVVKDVRRELQSEVGRAVEAGVKPERVWLDPGIGFAKTTAQSLESLARVSEFRTDGHRVVVGASRKAFLGRTVPRSDGSIPGPLERVGGTAATVAWATLAGADAVRVHDVAVMRQAVRVTEALGMYGPPDGGHA